MRHILILLALFLSHFSLAQAQVLLSGQPILSQMTGNCYTHAGTDTLTGIYLKRTGASSVNQPHPLLLGGIYSGHVGRSNISSGISCNFFNEAKKTRGELCSVQAFNRFVGTRRGMTPEKLASNVNTLDNSLKSLQQLFDKRDWSKQDKESARKSAGDIISAVCNLNGVVDLSNPKFAQLVDDARDIIETLSADTPSIGSIIWSEFTDLVTNGFGPYLFRRAGDATSYVGELMKFDSDRRTTINKVLNESYQNMNSRCVAYARANNLPRVPSDFFGMTARYNCQNVGSLRPLRSVAQMKPSLTAIENQLKAGIATPIDLCSAAFYGKYPKLGGYRKPDGSCENGGAHAVTATGVVIRNGRKMFRIRNSWGTDACKTVTNGRRVCAQSGQDGCPGPSSLDCEEGVYYMSENYLSKVLFRYGKITN